MEAHASGRDVEAEEMVREELGRVFGSHSYMEVVTRTYDGLASRRGAQTGHKIKIEDVVEVLPGLLSAISDMAYEKGCIIRIAVPRRSEVEFLFKDHDSDRDGLLTRLEFKSVVEECAKAATRALLVSMLESGIDTFHMDTMEGGEDEEWNALTSEVALLKTRCEEVDFANRKLDEKFLSVEESLSGTHSSQEELERRVQEIHRLYHRLEADLGKSAAPSSSIDEAQLVSLRRSVSEQVENTHHALVRRMEQEQSKWDAFVQEKVKKSESELRRLVFDSLSKEENKMRESFDARLQSQQQEIRGELEPVAENMLALEQEFANIRNAVKALQDAPAPVSSGPGGLSDVQVQAVVSKSQQAVTEHVRRLEERVVALERAKNALEEDIAVERADRIQAIKDSEKRLRSEMAEDKKLVTSVVEDLLTRLSDMDTSMSKLHRENGEMRTRMEALELNKRQSSGPSPRGPSDSSASNLRRKTSILSASSTSSAGGGGGGRGRRPSSSGH